MGCKLGPILNSHIEDFPRIAKKKVAVDGTNLIFKYLMKIRAGNHVLSDSKGRPISHLLGLFYFTINMYERHVLPIVIFDGLPLKEKRETPPWKIERLVNLWKRHLYAVKQGNVKMERHLFHDQQFSFEFILTETIELLKVLGVPTCRAPADAEAQCARLVQEGKAYATLSHDYDSLLFGSNYMIYDFDFKKNWFKYYSLPEALRRWGITRSQLVDIALLVGTDFNNGVKGIGPKKGLKGITTHGDLETFRHQKGFEISFDPDLVRQRFLHPVTIDFTPLFRAPNDASIRHFLTHRFSNARIVRGLARLRTAVTNLHVFQTSITKFIHENDFSRVQG